MFVRPFGAHCEVQTPAKLNLFLEVLGRRPDGFHELETLMTTVSVFDSLCLVAEPTEQIRITCQWAQGLAAEEVRSRTHGESCTWDALPAAEDNLVYRAVRALRERAGVDLGASIQLVKRIPAAAGLGGASSDAAAALVAANQAWGLGWNKNRLAEVAESLGSDISFFLAAGRRGGFAGTAVCRGRGERVTSVPGFAPLAVVLVRPPAGLSTAAVFRACSLDAEPRSVEPLLRAAARGDLAGIGRSLHNGLQSAAAQLSPWLDRLQREFRRLDVVGHAMSGSGSTYFGLCRHVGQARRLANRLRNLHCGTVFWGVTGR